MEMERVNRIEIVVVPTQEMKHYIAKQRERSTSKARWPIHKKEHRCECEEMCQNVNHEQEFKMSVSRKLKF